MRRLLPYLRLLSLTPLETLELPPTLLSQDEKLAVLEANVKKPALTRAALNKIPKILCTDTNNRRVMIQEQKLFTAYKPPYRENMKRMNSKEYRCISNTLRVVPKMNLSLIRLVFLGCQVKSGKNLSEKMLINAKVTATTKANKSNFEILLTKGQKGEINLEKDPIFLPKNKETEITLTLSLIGTAYFLDLDSTRIDNTTHFKRLVPSKENFVYFFDSIGFVTV